MVRLSKGPDGAIDRDRTAVPERVAGVVGVVAQAVLGGPDAVDWEGVPSPELHLPCGVIAADGDGLPAR